jgi:2-amino-4-hydroxy-6-hydroxymethyldihydropteridine diphosphokinase
MLKSKSETASQFDAALGLGSNMGDKAANLDRAIELLTAEGGVKLVRRSRNYRSAPWGVAEQDWFVNACVTVQTDLSARELLKRCQDVENSMGRERKQKWGPRLIDVDILTYRDQTIRETDLTVPHPLIAERGFVMIPLQEVAPHLKLNKQPLSALIKRLDVRDIVPLGGAARK